MDDTIVTSDGEVITRDQVINWGAEYATLLEDLAFAEGEVGEIRGRLSKLEVALKSSLSDVIPAVRVSGDLVVVLEPGKIPSRSVSEQGCEEYREVLQVLGMTAREETVTVKWTRPTVSSVDQRAAELIAAGIDLSRIVPPRLPGPPVLKVVKG